MFLLGCLDMVGVKLDNCSVVVVGMNQISDKIKRTSVFSYPPPRALSPLLEFAQRRLDEVGLTFVNIRLPIFWKGGYVRMHDYISPPPAYTPALARRKRKKRKQNQSIPKLVRDIPCE